MTALRGESQCHVLLRMRLFPALRDVEKLE